MNNSFQPGKTYTITYSSKLKDKWGQELGQDYVFSFTEPDADPSLSLGTYLPVLFTRPEDPTISVQAVNLNSINVSHGSMSLDDFLRTEADYNYRQTFIPADLQTKTVNPGLARNDNQPMAITLSDSPLATGFYYTNVDSPELQNRQNNQHTLVVSNLNVTLKASPSEVLLWAMDLRTQSPAKNIALALYDNKGGKVASGSTDEKGLWRGQLPEGVDNGDLYAILGQPGDDLFGVANSGWSQGLSSWDFGLRSDNSGPRPEVYVYTERPVYRPGDIIHYRGIVKNWYDG